MWMGQTDKVDLLILNQLLNRTAPAGRGRMSVDNAKTSVRKSDPDRFADSRLKKVNRQLSFRSVGGRRCGVR